MGDLSAMRLLFGVMFILINSFAPSHFLIFAQQCQTLITNQLQANHYECISGCIVLQDQDEIFIPSFSLVNIDDDITTCITIKSIKTLRIDSFILSNVNMNLQSISDEFLQISYIDNLIITSLEISNVVASPDSLFDFTILAIEESVRFTEISSLTLEGDCSAQDFSFLTTNLVRFLSTNLQIESILLLGFKEKALFSSETQIIINQITFDLTARKEVISDLTVQPLVLQSQNQIQINTIRIIVLSPTKAQQRITNIIILDPPKENSKSSQMTLGTSINFGRSQQFIDVLTLALQPITSVDLNRSTLDSDQIDKITEVNQNRANITINEITPEQTTQGITSHTIDSIFWYFSFTDSESISIGRMELQYYNDILMSFFKINILSISEILIYNPISNPQLSIHSRLLMVNNISEVSIGSFKACNVIITDDVAIFVLFNSTTLRVNSTLISDSSFQGSQIYNLENIQNVFLSDLVFSNVNLIASQANIIQPLFYLKTCGSVIISQFQLQSLASRQSSNHRRQLSHAEPEAFRGISNRVIQTERTKNIKFTQVNIDLKRYNIGFFEAIDSLDLLSISNSLFQNCFAELSGGCFNFRVVSNSQGISEPNLHLISSNFTKSTSGYFGGAISGFTLAYAKNSRFSYCTSLIGGAIYSTSSIKDSIISSLQFESNFASLVDSDVSFGVRDIKKSFVYEYNPNLENTFMYINPVGEYTEDTQFYAGILYIIQLKLKINDSWYSELPNSQNNNGNGIFINGNLFQFAKTLTYIQNSELENCTYFYLLFDPMNLSSWIYSKQFIQFIFAESYIDISLDFRSENDCSHEMETINLSNGYNQICAYCGFTKAFNELTNDCESCDMNYFSLCYVNQTILRTGFWRSNYTMNTTQIETCSISKLNCNGGNGTGNSLCYTGHIGAQCLNCDIRGEYWGESYSMSGVSSCSQCSAINLNNFKIFFGYILILLSLLLTIKGNFKATKNQIYADYLSHIKMIYIGSSLNRMQQTSTLVKVLLFNVFFTNLANSFVKLRVFNSLQEVTVVLSEPLMSQFFSLDCFLVEYLSPDINIGFANLVLAVATPGSIFLLILIFSIIAIIIKPLLIRTIVSSLSLAFMYLFIIAFFPFILELCLKSMHCIRLEGSTKFSLIDLSLECEMSERNNGMESQSSLELIHTLALPILIIFILIVPLATLMLIYIQRAQLRTVNVMLTLGFLYQEYKQEFFLWEFVRILLKSTCVFVSVAFVGEPRLYGSLVSIFLMGYMILIGLVHPFKGKQFNQLEQISVFIQILSIQSAVLYQDYISTNDNDESTLVKVLFISSQILNLIFVLWLGVLVLVAFFQKNLIKIVKKRRIPWLEKLLPLYSQNLRQNMKKFRNIVHQLKGHIKQVEVEELKGFLSLEVEVRKEEDCLKSKLRPKETLRINQDSQEMLENSESSQNYPQE